LDRPRVVESLRTETAIVPEGLLADPTVSGDAKAFMAFLGRHLRGSHYRVTGLPSQAELGRRFFGWRRQHVNEVVAELKQAFWLDTSGDGYSMPCCYLIRSPQMALELNKTRAKASKSEWSDTYLSHWSDSNITTPYCLRTP
jgi:hypothetical protein